MYANNESQINFNTQTECLEKVFKHIKDERSARLFAAIYVAM